MDEFIGRRIEDEVVKGQVFRDALKQFRCNLIPISQY